jgi:hypothetical protein
LASTNIKPNPDNASLDFATITFNMAMTKKVVSTYSFQHIIHSFNTSTAFHAIKCEKPSAAAFITTIDSKVSGKENTKMCVISLFNKYTFL